MCKYDVNTKFLFEANLTTVTQIRSLLHICCCFVTHVNLFFRPVIRSVQAKNSTGDVKVYTGFNVFSVYERNKLKHNNI